jgi:hypothetical protein
MRRIISARSVVLSGMAVGVTGVTLVVLAAAASGSPPGNVLPTLTAGAASFVIPSQPSGQWVLKLWTMPKPTQQVGKTTGTSGTLTLSVPATSTCEFQVDVRYAPPDSQHFAFYSGLIATVPSCGDSSTTSTTSTTTTSPADGTTTTTTDVGVATAASDSGTTTPTTGATTPGTLATTGVGAGAAWTGAIGALLAAVGAGLLVLADAPHRSWRRLAALGPAMKRRHRGDGVSTRGTKRGVGDLRSVTRTVGNAVASGATRVANWTIGR